MPTETLAPGAIISSTNLSGAVTDIDEPVYQAQAVNFDGTNDYLLTTAAFTGLVDGPNVTVSFWYRATTSGANMNLVQSTSSRALLIKHFIVADAVSIRFTGVDGQTKFLVSGPAHTDTNWHHFVASTNGTTGHGYFDGASRTITTLASADLDLAVAAYAVGSNTTGGTKWAGDMADIWMSAEYVDLSVLANREKFIKSNQPADLGTDGSKPTGNVPVLYLSGATDSWHTNKGGGAGGLTENGALADGSGPVQL